MTKLKEIWSKLSKWIKILIITVVVIIVISMFGSNSEKTAVQKCTDTYDLENTWCEVMNQYIPNFETLSNIQNEGTSAYKVTLSNGNQYYVVIDGKNEVAKIMTTEKDYDSRTTLYDAYK